MNKYLFLLFLPALVLIASCSSDGAFSVADGLIDVNTKLTVIDTSTLDTYTIKYDSVLETASQKLLVGRYSDGEFGTITASSYLEMGYSSSLSLESIAVFDSMSLILTNTGYCYGDSTQLFNLEVHQLTANLADNPNITSNNPNLAGYRYSNSKVAYDANILGQTAYYPRPNRSKALHVKLSDSFGLAMFDSIKAKSEIATSLDRFIKYFKGIVLTTDAASISSVQRFSGEDSALFIRMYYHAGTEQKTIDLLRINSSSSRPYELPFNQIIPKYTSSKVNRLTRRQSKLGSDSTDNVFYSQPGVGLMSRIEMPYLRNLLLTNGNIKIMKAQLILCPARGTYSTIGLPKKLALYEADKQNEVGSLVNDTTATQLTIDYEYNETTAYTIDITAYVIATLSSITDETPALIVTQPAGKVATTLDRVIFTNGFGLTSSTRLRILYWKY